MKRTVQWQQATAAGLLAALSAGTTLAQSGTPAPRDDDQPTARPIQPARAKGVRRPVIDLERMAKERRPGQVLPGDPPPFADKPAAPGVLPKDLLAPIPRQPARIAEPVNPPAPVAAPANPAPAPERMPVPERPIAPRTEPAQISPAPAPTPAPAPAEPAASSAPAQPGVMVSDVFTGTPPAATVPMTELRPAEPVASTAPIQPEAATPEAPVAPSQPEPTLAAPATEQPRGIVLIEAAPPAQPAEPPAAPIATPIEAAPIQPAQPIAEPAPTPTPVPAAASIEATAPAARPAPEETRGVSPAPTPPRVAIAEPQRDVPPPRDQTVGLLDERIVPRMPAPASLGPCRVSLRSVAGDASQAQWRTGSTAWRSPEVGESVEGRIEVRAGIDADVRIVIDDAVEVTLTRLGRVIIERAVEVGGGTLPAITVARGAIEVRPLKEEGAGSENAHARVRTPDQTFGVRGPLRVEYDAFGGTRRTPLPG